MRLPTALVSLLVLAAGIGFASAQNGQVTIYRCTDTAGRVMLRDTPCPTGQQQDSRRMLRPTDAPARTPVAVAPVSPPPPAAAAAQVLIVQAPQPMYECITPDGQRYSSDNSEGNPRWVPLWTLGYPVVAEDYRYRSGSARIEVRDGRVGGELRSGSVERGLRPTIAGYGAGTWVRDRCVALPPAEACARLRDERSALRTRIFNAQPTERDRLGLQERGINARLARECGGA